MNLTLHEALVVLVLRHLVSAGSSGHFLAHFASFVLIAVVHLGLHLVAIVAVVDEDAAHVHS